MRPMRYLNLTVDSRTRYLHYVYVSLNSAPIYGTQAAGHREKGLQAELEELRAQKKKRCC